MKRFLIFTHRWLGVALCLLFLIWFPSGIGMMYWDFPSVTPADRIERMPALTPASIVLSPAEAAARAGIESPGDVRLNSFDGRPVYRFRATGGDAIVYADTGEEQIDVPREMRDRAAARWSSQPIAAAAIGEVTDVDQWTVQSGLRNLRPLWKYSWPDGQQVYVAGTTGEVVQYTTTASRWGAYVGAIPHWLYFTPLRRHQAQWSAFVIWTSAVGTIAAILGIVVGVWMYSPAKRYRHRGAATAIPYRGQKRLHMIFGLIFGVGAATWAFSGMLSMDPFPARSPRPAPGVARRGGGLAQALRTRPRLDAFAGKHPREALTELAGLDVRELELTSFAGAPVYFATLGGGDVRVVPVSGPPQLGFDTYRVMQAVRQAAASAGGADVELIDHYDAYYLDRHFRKPLPVLVARLHDEDRTRYYVDPRTARVVGSYSARGWMSRWLYHGLHSLDFPWLYAYRPLWDIVVITFMVGGTVLAFTSLVLAWRVLGRTLARGFTAAPDADDLQFVVE